MWERREQEKKGASGSLAPKLRTPALPPCQSRRWPHRSLSRLDPVLGSSVSHTVETQKHAHQMQTNAPLALNAPPAWPRPLQTAAHNPTQSACKSSPHRSACLTQSSELYPFQRSRLASKVRSSKSSTWREGEWNW